MMLTKYDYICTFERNSSYMGTYITKTGLRLKCWRRTLKCECLELLKVLFCLRRTLRCEGFVLFEEDLIRCEGFEVLEEDLKM